MSKNDRQRRDAASASVPDRTDHGNLGSPQISFEFFPPSEPSALPAFWAAVHRLEVASPRFVSVTYGAAGSTRDRTRQCVAEILARTRLAAAPHLTCVGASRDELRAVVRDYWQLGVRHIVALRGDGLNGERFERHPDGFAGAHELVSAVRQIAPFDISVAAYPETHPEALSADADLDHLIAKLDAGAARAITQFFFDANAFLRFRDRCQKRGIRAPIVPGILPIAQFAQTVRFAKRCGASIPGWLAKCFDGLESDPVTSQLVAVSVAVSLIERLRREGVEQFHLYTLNRAEPSVAICRALEIDAHTRQPSDATG